MNRYVSSHSGLVVAWCGPENCGLTIPQGPLFPSVLLKDLGGGVNLVMAEASTHIFLN